MAQAKTSAKPKAKVKTGAKKVAARAKKPAAKKTTAAAKKTTTKKTAAAAKKPAAKKTTAAAKKPATKKTAAAAKKTTTKKTAAAAKKPAAKKLPFARGDYVVYPTHGVGKVTGIEKREVAGFNLQLFVIMFDSEKMTLRVPIEKAANSGLRKISSKDKMQAVVATLKGRARSKRTMWSRRAQEYEAKINSGDPVAIAEVVRDLYRAADQPEQSYSERQMYEAALERLVHEFALVERLDVDAATQKIEDILAG